MAKRISCQHCGKPMKKTATSTATMTKTGLSMMFFGIGILFCLTIVGAIVGLPMILVAGLLLGKRKKVWKCRGCRVVIDRT